MYPNVVVPANIIRVPGARFVRMMAEEAGAAMEERVRVGQTEREGVI